MWGFFVSLTLDPAFDALFDELGWAVRSPRSADELVIGDYAEGYLLLQRPDFIQIARRSVRGEPALKMWTPSFAWSQQYLAFWVARRVRYERELTDVSVPVGEESLNPGFRLDLSDPTGVFLLGDRPTDWAAFGRGNVFAAVQFSNYARGSVAATIDAVLPDSELPA